MGYPGYGVIYPQKSRKGLKVTRVWSEASKKVRQADGSWTMTEASPTIFELVDGAFCYGSGQVVKDRKHLEVLPGSMREKALAWFDAGDLSLSKEVIVAAPPQEKLEPPPPNFIRSDERPDIVEAADAFIHGEIRPEPEEKEEKVLRKPDVLLQKELGDISKALKGITNILVAQEDRISQLEVKPKGIALAHKKQGMVLKQKWQDPEFKAKMKKARDAASKESKDGDRGSEAV